MLVCVNKEAALYEALLQGQPFCVNLLDAGQRRLSVLCSQTELTEERFDGEDWQRTEDGTPWLADCQANIFCTCVQSLEVGSHGIFVGQVRQVRESGGGTPLLYCNGDYRQIGDPVLD